MSVLEIALLWNKLGIATIPILAMSKEPALPSWHEYTKRLPTERELKAWFCVSYNLGIVCGPVSHDLVVVDVDDPTLCNAWETLAEMDTYHVQSARGWHYYLYVEDEVRCWKGEGVDVKAAGGYVLAPPSIHPTGHQYRGFGSLECILRVHSIKEILPEYEPPALLAHVSRPADPYDMAMRQECGISVASIKATWRWEDVLSVNGTARRGVVMVNCPFHQDDHASMALYPDKHAHCFGCGLHLSIIDFFALLHNLTIPEAMRSMANG